MTQASNKPKPRRIEVPAMGAEDVVIDHDGYAWTGTADGSIWRVSKDGAVTEVGNTGGRPLGIELLDGDRLLICDAEAGLLAMSTSTGVIERLATEIDGHRILVCNNASVASNGDIWFSDSSTRYPLSRWKSDFLEHTRTGRLICRRADGSRRGAPRGARVRQRGGPGAGRVLRLRRRVGWAERRTTVAAWGARRHP